MIFHCTQYDPTDRCHFEGGCHIYSVFLDYMVVHCRYIIRIFLHFQFNLANHKQGPEKFKDYS